MFAFLKHFGNEAKKVLKALKDVSYDTALVKSQSSRRFALRIQTMTTSEFVTDLLSVKACVVAEVSV